MNTLEISPDSLKEIENVACVLKTLNKSVVDMPTADLVRQMVWSAHSVFQTDGPFGYLSTFGYVLSCYRKSHHTPNVYDVKASIAVSMLLAR